MDYSVIKQEVEVLAAELRGHVAEGQRVSRLFFQQVEDVLMVSFWNGFTQQRVELTCAAPQIHRVLSAGGFQSRQAMWRYQDGIQDALAHRAIHGGV